MEKSQQTVEQQAALKVRGACHYLGVSRSTLNRLIERGEIKPVRKIRHLIIPIAELDRWLRE
jgi:excisionase family DNA binding protein